MNIKIQLKVVLLACYNLLFLSLIAATAAPLSIEQHKNGTQPAPRYEMQAQPDIHSDTAALNILFWG